MSHPNPPGLVDEVLAVLEPCPFCGSRALIGETLDNFWYAMCSRDECLQLLNHYDTEAEAIAAWNTRHLHTRIASQGGGEDGLREALAWYGEQARLCRLIHSEGDSGRHALANDGGKRADAALSATQQQREGETCAVMDGPGGAELGQCITQEEQQP